MKRAVHEAVGGLDEQFGLGFFDDDDLAERARRAGFELAVAHDLFVHHYGSRTLQGNAIDTERLPSENGRKFAEKWGPRVGNGRAFELKPWVESNRNQPRMNTDLHGWDSGMQARQESGAVAPQTGSPSFLSDPCSIRVSSVAQRSSTCKATTSLTMIVRDEENNLPACLSSVAGLFDEIVVVDTGSTDRTAEIAREFGARVFDFLSGLMTSPRPATRRWRGQRAIMPSGSTPMMCLICPSEKSSRPSSMVCGPGMRPRMWSAARAIRDRTAAAGRRWWTISGCFRCARECAGPMRYTSRSCWRCGGRMCRCAGPTSRSGTPATPTRHCGNASSSATARSSRPSWPENSGQWPMVSGQ